MFLRTDLVYALRGLMKSPGFALAALAILTLGIGANTAVFSIVNSVLLRPLPFPESDAIVTVLHVPPAKAFPGLTTFPASAANYLDWRKQNTVFESMSIIRGRLFRLGGDSRPQSVLAALIEADFFKVVRVAPAVGRAFTADESQPGRGNVVILSHAFAENHFGSPAEAVGKTLELNGSTHRVVGVMPAKFVVKSWFPAAVDAWVPFTWTPEEAATRNNHNRLVVGRLRSGVEVAEAQSQMNVISEQLARAYPEDNTGWGAVVTMLRDRLVGDVRPALLTLLGAVAFVLLIACANTANLVLVRTMTRRKELAIRSALGASAGQVMRPVLLETTLLALAGGALGLLFAQSGQALIVKALADRIPRSTEIQLDGQVMAFTFVASLLTGLAAGLIASWRLTRIDLNESLKLGLGKTDSYSGGSRTRGALVVAEVAMSLMLLVGAGLMIRSLSNLYKVDPGFVASNVITMSVPIPQSKDPMRRNLFYDEFLSGVRRLPGVKSVAAIDSLPFINGGSQQPIVIEGRPAEVFALQPNVGVRDATPGYLQTMRIPLIAGRDFSEADTVEKAKDVILVSQAMAKQFWPGENPIGKRLRISFSPEVSREVIGVVGDVKERGLQVLEPLAMLYRPIPQNRTGSVSLVVRTEQEGATLAPAITSVLHQINPELPVRDIRSMDEMLANSLSQQRFSMYLFVALAGLAFLLAAVGIYSVLAYTVRSRLQEISIRIALGAQVPDVLSLVVMEGMKPTIIGIAVGAVGAWLTGGILSRLIFGVSPADPYTFGVVAALLATVALIACLLPAVRATRVKPISALRNE